MRRILMLLSVILWLAAYCLPARAQSPPANPTGLTAAGSNNQVVLTWVAPAGPVASYTVYRSYVSGGVGVQKTTKGITTTTFTDTSVVNGTAYYYHVTATNSNGESSQATSPGLTITPPNSPPATPAGLTATAGDNQVTLSWTEPAGPAPTSYKILRGTSSGNETNLNAAASTSFTDTTAANGTTYYYEVSALVAGGGSSSSNEAFATPYSSPPSVATAAAASPNPVASGKTTALSVLGASQGGESGLTYTWTATGSASVTYSANGTNAAKTTTATFTKAGAYSFTAKITDNQGGSVTSSVSVTVNQALTSIAVSPASASVATGATQQFAATASDQFGTVLTTQPGFTWSVSGGGTISGSGLFTAGTTAGGPFTVTAASGSVSGTASVVVSSTSSVSLTSLSLAQSTLQAGSTGVGAVALSGPAQANTQVSLSSSDPSVMVPTSVTVLAGQATASFNITSNATDQTQAMISATYGGVADVAQLSVVPAIALTTIATSSSKITLYWNGVSGAVGYNIYRTLSVTGTYMKLNAVPYHTSDTGIGVTNMFMYSDVGLTSGTDYFYYVVAVNSSGVQGLQSNTDSSIPDSSAISWDTGNAAIIVPQVQTMVANNLVGDETLVGALVIAGPDGVMYQLFPDGNPPQANASPAYFNSSTHTLVYVDGNEIPAPIDTTQSQPAGIPDIVGSTSATSVGSPVVTIHNTPIINETYYPTTPPTGIFREVQTQPGYPSLMSYVGLPYPYDYTLVNVDGRKYKAGDPNSSIFNTSDTGFVYTGGTAYQPVVGSDGKTTLMFPTEIDAGLLLYRSSDRTKTGYVGHPGWQPFCSAQGGIYFDTGIVGLPLEYDQAAANYGCSKTPQVFVTGEPLMSFKAPGYGTIPDGVVVLGIHALSDGQVFQVDASTGAQTQIQDVTYVRAGLRGWKKSAYIVLKRMNSIGQKFMIVGAGPPTLGPYVYNPFPDGPGYGFAKSGSFLHSMSWGDLSSDSGSVIDGVTLFPGGQWTDTLTWQEGSYPGPNNPSPGNPYVGKLIQSDYFWEQNINLQTNP